MTQKKRRGRGEGSVYQAKSGRHAGTWVATLSIGVPFGRTRARKIRRYAPTKRDAERVLSELKEQHRKGELLEASTARVSDLFEAWFGDVMQHRLEARTLDDYRSLYELHIKPLLGHLLVQRLTSQHIVKWQSDRLGVLGNERVRKARTMLYSALEHARTPLRLIALNPVQDVRPARSTRPQRPVLDLSQVRAYFEAVAGDRLEALVVLAILTTMREGELLGLHWSDVDWDGCAVCTRTALKRTIGSKHEIGPITKSKASRRRIDVPALGMALLARHKLRMEAEGHRSPLVFCSTRGTPLNPSNVRNRLHYPMLKKAGLPKVTFHDLRHTAATLLLSLGVHPKVAQERLGHATIAMTMDLYSHTLPSLQKDAARLLGEALIGGHEGGQTPKPSKNGSKRA